MIDDSVVAVARVDRVGAARAIDDVVAGTAGEVFAADEPVIDSPVDTAEASTFWKLVTLVESPDV